MKLTKSKVRLLSIALIASVFLLSCSKEVTNNYIEGEPPIGKTVSDNPTEILSFNDVLGTYKKGDMLKLRINRTGDKIEEYSVKFEGTYNFNNERLILCKTPEGLVVGQGDSGSPVLTTDGKVVGILCYGYYFNNYQFCARAIEDVLDVGTNLKSATTENNSSNTGFVPLGTSNFAFGMTQEGLERYARNDKRGYVSKYQHSSTYEQTINDRNKSASTANLIAGNSICVQEISGDRVNFVATGTASYITDNKIYGFGHAYTGIKPVAIPAFVADMKTMIESGNVAFKMSVPTKTSIGGMVADEMEGILIDKTATPATFDVTTEITIESNSTKTDVHKIASFSTVDQELYHAMNLPGYLVFDYLREESLTIVNAKGSINIKFEGGTYNKSFDVTDEAYWIDWMIYDQINMDFNSENYDGNIESVNFTATISESTF